MVKVNKNLKILRYQELWLVRRTNHTYSYTRIKVSSNIKSNCNNTFCFIVDISLQLRIESE